MIYAIRAIEAGLIKFGRAKSAWKRMAMLQTGAPYELEMLAVADWPDGSETGIHQYLSEIRVRGEWFKESEASAKIVVFMNDKKNGLQMLKNACAARHILEWAVTAVRATKPREQVANSVKERRAEREAWWERYGDAQMKEKP